MPCCSSWKCSTQPGMGKIMHRFPRDPLRRQIWADLVNRENWRPNNHSFLCSDHFEDSQYENGRMDNLRRLRNHAVPTLFAYQKLSLEFRRPSTKRERSSNEDSPYPMSPGKKILIEHNYCSRTLCLTPVVQPVFVHNKPSDDQNNEEVNQEPDITEEVNHEVEVVKHELDIDIPEVNPEPDVTEEVNPEPDMPEVNPEPDMPEVNPEPDMPEVNPEPDMPEVNHESDIPEVKQEPDIPEEVNHEPDIPEEVNHEPDIPEVNQEPDIPEEVNHEPDIPEVKPEPDITEEVNQEPDITEEVNHEVEVVKHELDIDIPEVNHEPDISEVNPGESEPAMEVAVSVVNTPLEKKIKRQEATIARLRKILAKERSAKRILVQGSEALERKLSKMFSPNQLLHLGKLKCRGMKWSADVIRKGHQLRFTCGARGYQLLLSQGQPLPSVRSLRRKMEVMSIEPGILTQVFGMLRLKASALSTEEKECCLLLDEMPLQSGMQYDRSSNCLRGNVILPGHEGIATHALVIMLVGVTSRWKQTVAYYFTGNSVDGSSLKPIILEIIRRAHNVGLHVNSITCDMGNACQALWTSFGVVVTRRNRTVNKIEHPYKQGRYIYFLADVPHVIKNLKACLTNANTITLSNEIVSKFRLPSNVVNMDHVRDLAAFQAEKGLQLVPKLTESSLTPGHLQQMKLLHAINLFSPSVSSGLRYLVACEDRDECYITTAWFLEFVNKWVNLMSNRHPAMALSQCNKQMYQETVAHLESVVRTFKTMFIGKVKWDPVQKGVILATSSVLHLHVELLSIGHTSILTSRFTQDYLENLFKSIQLKNPVPNCLEFRQTLKMITAAQFLKCPAHGSYMEDEREFLAEFLDKSLPQNNTHCDIDLYNINLELPLSDIVLEQSIQNSLCYIAGYCISRLKMRRDLCHVCLESLETKSTKIHRNGENVTVMEEHWDDCHVQCSSECIQIIKGAEVVFLDYEDKLIGYHLTQRLVALAEFETYHIELPQCHDIKQQLLNTYFTLRLHLYAKKQQQLRHAANRSELSDKKVEDESSNKDN